MCLKLNNLVIYLTLFYKLVHIKTFTKFTGKHLCRNLFLIKIPARWPATLTETPAQVFSVTFVNFLRTPILNMCERLLLKNNKLSIQNKKWCNEKPFNYLPEK